MQLDTHAGQPFSWSTSSFGSPADGETGDSDGLAAHIARCNDAGGAWFQLRCMADVTSNFIASRLITTMGIAVVGFAVISIFA